MNCRHSADAEIARWDRAEKRQLARAAKRIKPPWQPLDTAPRDGREILGLWIDDLGTWNVDLVCWHNGNFLGNLGCVFDRMVGWMPRPPLPGRARLK